MEKRSIQNLFICSTVFQIFNVINLCGFEFGFECSDILIIDYGTNISDYLNLDFMKSKFNSVDIVKHTRRNKNIDFYIDVLKRILQNKIACNMRNTQYANIFISGTEIYSKIYAYKYMNYSTNLFYIEDGLGSYDSVLDKDSKMKQDTVFRIFYKKRPLELCKRIYLYEPNCVINNSYKKEVYEIPKIKKNTQIAETISNIFTGDVIEIHQKVIFLEAWFNKLDQYEYQRELIQVVIDAIGSENVGIKKHPNGICKVDLYKNNNVIEGISSFELNNFYYSLNNKIIISIISTASFTPKMIYDEEPYVIFLYKIFLLRFTCPEWNETGKVIEKIKSNYKKPSKIIVPESINELKKYLNQLSVI